MRTSPYAVGSQQRPELGAKQFGFVEADADRAPSQERVLFPWHVQEHGELVPAEVERTDVYGAFGKGLRSRLVGFELLFLTGHGIASQDEELGTEQPYSVGSVQPRLLGFDRQVEIGTQLDELTVFGH